MFEINFNYNSFINYNFKCQSFVFLGVQPPTAASLLSQLNPTPPQYPPAATNPLLQALIGQAAPGAPAPQMPSPIAPPPSAPATQPGVGNNQALNQLAMLLQGKGIDPNALSALLKPDDSSRQQQASKSSSNGGYSTTYPSTSTYDMYYSQSNNANANYGAKDDQESKRYRPY